MHICHIGHIKMGVSILVILVILVIFMHICYILHIACAMYLILFRLSGYELSRDEDEPALKPDDPADSGNALDDMQPPIAIDMRHVLLLLPFLLDG